MEAGALEIYEIVLRVIGGFYAFAGYVATRAALTAHFVDEAIAALTAKSTAAAERTRSACLLVTALLVLAGGVALMLLLDVAAWLFAAAAAVQAVYLFYLAPTYFDGDDPPDAKGRRQSTNAFVLYGAATAYVLWAALTGRLLGVNDLPWPVPLAAGVAVSAYTMRSIWIFSRPMRQPSRTTIEPDF